MKQTYDTLRDLYLHDLQQPDVHHGKAVASKTRRIEPWTRIESYYAANKVAPEGDTWVWSDLHFGHKNIIKYSNRPFETMVEMHDSLIRNYLSVVKQYDTVIFGGDISFMSVNNMNEILDQLPGYKIQIIGNHDFERSGAVMDLNFDERHLCMVRDIPDTEFQLLFSHYPLDTVPINCVSVHGHIHQHLGQAHNINICVEHTNYAPLNIKEVERRAISYLTT